ncbi:MAG: carbohydrate ABC transporter permease [Candidatus Merdivicinus sp.]|jgi:putative aldouronate transport system permease protein
MKIKRPLSERIFEVFNLTFMTILMIVTIYPFWYVLIASISKPAQFMAHKGILMIPQGFSLDSYIAVFNNPSIWTGYRNTLLYVVLGTTLNVFLTIITAYVLSRKHFLLKNFLMVLAVFTMFFSGGLIPSYLVVKDLHLTETIFAIILPSAISTYNVIVLRTAFLGVPDALEESAKIDNANDWVILFRIILPVCMPSVAVITLFYAVGHWNSWFSAMIYLRDRTMYPLQLILREILVLSNVEDMTTGLENQIAISETIKYATIIVATVPILIVYPFLQKYFVKGVMIGAIKG